MMIEGEFVCASNDEEKKIRNNSVVILTKAAQNLNVKSYIVSKMQMEYLKANAGTKLRRQTLCSYNKMTPILSEGTPLRKMKK